jgi:hypothetical protein
LIYWLIYISYYANIKLYYKILTYIASNKYLNLYVKFPKIEDF